MTTTIAFAGKGGTGKTTLASLLILGLLRRGAGPILAVDADPNSNLGEALGVEVRHTVGAVREAVFSGARDVPPGWDKASWMEYRMEEALTESEGFDLLVMGRPEGPGCYCYANSVLREHIRTLGSRYPYVVIDNEAGLEHLSRHTDGRVDIMFVVSDPSTRGTATSQRISALADELGLEVGQRHLVLNRVPAEISLDSLAGGELWPPLIAIPEDPMLLTNDLAGRSLRELPCGSPSGVAVEALVDRVMS